MGSGQYDRKRVPVSQRHMSVEASIGSDGNLVPVTIDGRTVLVSPGTTILDAARRLNIFIPTLCTHEDLCVVGNCRVCAVEVGGFDTLQAACAFPIMEPVEVRTHSPAIRTARRHMIQLLLAHHEGECFSCGRKGSCELLDLSQTFGVESVGFARNQEPRTLDTSSSLLVRDMKKCVLCRRCVRACIDMQEVGVLEAVGKGDHIEIETFANKPMKDVVCIGCGQCIAHCPTAALANPDNTGKVWEAIEDPSRHVVVQLSPSVRAAIGEMLGMEPGTLFCGELIAMMRQMGFDAVFDTQLAMSLTVYEQAKLLVENMFRDRTSEPGEHRPMFSGNCSGWVKYLEHFGPAFLKYLSPLKSPEQLMGALVRTHYAQRFGGTASSVVSVAVVPCSSRKFEADSPLHLTGGMKNIDFAITTLELGKMLKESGAARTTVAPRGFDPLIFDMPPMEMTASNSMLHVLMGTVFQMLTGVPLSREMKIEYESPFSVSGAYIMNVPIAQMSSEFAGAVTMQHSVSTRPGQVLRFGKCEGTANAKRVIADIRRDGAFSTCHFIEFMACSDGCFGGGGQPVPTSRQIRQARRESFPVHSVLPSVQTEWVQQLHHKCRNSALSGLFTPSDLTTSFMPRGKYIK